MRMVLRSERVFTQGKIQPADLVIEHDCITEVAPYQSIGQAYNLGDRLVVPGFVDLHSDAVEKEVEPRPGASFPVDNALVELDKKLAMSGITTMFHAIAFNEESLCGLRGNNNAALLIEAIWRGNQHLLSIDNLVHARYEVTSFTSVKILKKLMEQGMIQIFSFMDHTPGQGQFKSLEKWREYHKPVFELTDEAVEHIITTQLDKKKICMDYLVELSQVAKENGILLASHDDDTPAKIDLMDGLGVTIAEFPLCLKTASHARKHGMATGMGAPNIVRGQSQSGNISARLLVEHNLCDFLCSDYHPSSMLQGVYTMIREAGLTPEQAFAYVSTTPAAIAGLTDRGEIAPGKLADILVIEDNMVPKVVMTLKSGKPVYSGSSCLCIQEYA
jgi:alpha-D-ribose 1-methylphosphonate 5-triphosphate diphosphatase